MRNFAYINPEFEQDTVIPELVEGNYSERVSPLGLIVIVDSIKEENNFVELKTQNNEK
jgi:hypothetical protein